MIHRSFIGGGAGVRSLQAALIPPGPHHINASHTRRLETDTDTVLLVGLWSGIPLDYFFKVSGQRHLQDDFAQRFPAEVPEGPHRRSLLLRTLRLNCLTVNYAPIWEALWDAATEADRWTAIDTRLPTLSAPRAWTQSTPLRAALERRQALVEIDALTALILRLTPDQLCAMYRTQFGVLRGYEWKMCHDANGRQVPADVVRAYERDGEDADLVRYELPFTRPDREAEMRTAYAEFERRARA